MLDALPKAVKVAFSFFVACGHWTAGRAGYNPVAMSSHGNTPVGAHDLRESFLRFFEERGHRRLPSAPLVPPGDPTLLFTSAGMVQFKPYFMGQATPPHTRLTTVQKCFRTSDIDSVGDASHLTFFEMLGNFSISDYFKAEAIPWAWEFVTQVLRLDPRRLWAAVYLDDDEAYDLWSAPGRIPADRICRYGDEHNYWFSGDVGPCGPCSEIHYDFGEQFGCGPQCQPSHDCGRFLEIWNLVFMSFYCDGRERTPLPSRNIDTGAGLERIASVLLYESDGWDKNRRPSVYDTDLFRPIIQHIEKLSGQRYGADPAADRAIRIVAEHTRAVTFLVGDERTPVAPSNEERGYVVRRLLRRAVYFARRHLGIQRPVITDLADTVIASMAPAYPELERQRAFIADILAPEERRFDETLQRGLDIMEEILQRHRRSGVIPGAEAFLLHDTYGFPIELTREIAVQQGLSVDEIGFRAEMEKQRERARAAVGGAAAVAAEALYASLVAQPTIFTGYDSLETTTSVLALVAPGSDGLAAVQAVSTEAAGDASPAVDLFLAETPFYPEGGGQVGDRGQIVGAGGRVLVDDTQRVAERLIVHRGRLVEGRIAVGDRVAASVDALRRADTMRNHTATHLLHAALRQVLGAHVRQAGSLVAPDHLRFDFTHTEALTADEVAQVERLVNDKIRQNLTVHTRETTFDEAMSEGVLAFFGEKYGQQVRVVEVNTVAPRFSAELCGGTHCRRTGDVGTFIIVGESSIGSGMRRIEALTGRGAEQFIRARLAALDDIAAAVGGSRDTVAARVRAVVEEMDTLRKRIERLERTIASTPAASELLRRAVTVDGPSGEPVKVLAARVDAPSSEALRYFGDAVRKELGSGVAVLASVIDGRPQFVAIVTSDVVKSGPKADEILRVVAAITGGGGGGRPDMAQGGGKDVSKLDHALAAVEGAVRGMLSASQGKISGNA
mgnify:CR=1 FL=1